MRKAKVACFGYKKHDDIYVSNVSFSTNVFDNTMSREV